MKTLSDDVVTELEARPATTMGGYRRVLLRPSERDALCATVRALRAELERIPLAQSALRQLDELRAANQRATETNTALREQLAQVTQERDRAKEDLRILTQGRFMPQQ